MYIGLRPKVSDSEPQNSGDIPWMIKYDVIVSETALRLTFRSYRSQPMPNRFLLEEFLTCAIASRAGK